ncbi:MAG: EAL domain-containing protein [Desulfobulbus sp.]|jgi:diguanylate cyclase (GGDEF)-like protein|uniref:bifunctional diguanylate cyclase/phosphodiesterase n=1 Tax=Desulfobulbus sp. TaxID=895 RepID=UPI00284E35DC|nr:EAL domain-containing protein [Desulfobulbus sp.]MDR2550806.1 EAL domain-containing protein [Desulfobulbus sp.]
MTLYRQLLLFTLLVLVCLGIGLWVGDHRRTRDFLTDQLESHAQDTATSLGLSLSTLARGTDVPAMEAMINALFDRGFYQRILLRDIEGKALVDRHTDMSIEGVPDWFIRLTPLKAPQAEALIMHGWQQCGSIMVESHPGYAYKTLWKSALAAAQWCAAAAMAVALLGGFGLRRLLRPLHRVEEQAQALCDRKFIIQEHLPRTRELRRVVLAMNRMTERIRALFDEQTAIAETLRQRAYQDTLTGLGNRRFLEAQAKTKLTGRTTPVRGALLLIHIRNLQAINQQQGYTAGDQLIKEAAASIKQACAALVEVEVIAARLSGGDFALLLPNADIAMAEQLADTILAELCPPDAQQAGQPLPVVCGGAVHNQEIALGALLSQADTALASARYRNDNRAVIVPPSGEIAPAVTGRSERQTLLEDYLARGSVILYSQPVVSRDDRNLIVHHELLARMPDDQGNHLSIARFLPLAKQAGLMPALDRLILKRIFSLPPDQFAPRRITINLSPLSLADSGFVAWFSSHLRRCADAGLAIQVEFPEFRAVRYLHLIKPFAQEIRPMGHAFGIDHFGQAFSHFGYLKSLLPDYVKIDRAITNELQNAGDDSHFFVSALCTVAHSLDIKVVVEGVETEQQWQTVTGLPIDAVQGFLIRRPELVQRK